MVMVCGSGVDAGTALTALASIIAARFAALAFAAVLAAGFMTRGLAFSIGGGTAL